MNALYSINEPLEYQFEEKEHSDKIFIGDIVAVSIIAAYTLFTLVLSSWSLVLTLTGNFSSRSPIGLLVDLIKTSTLV